MSDKTASSRRNEPKRVYLKGLFSIYSEVTVNFHTSSVLKKLKSIIWGWWTRNLFNTLTIHLLYSKLYSDFNIFFFKNRLIGFQLYQTVHRMKIETTGYSFVNRLALQDLLRLITTASCAPAETPDQDQLPRHKAVLLSFWLRSILGLSEAQKRDNCLWMFCAAQPLLL